MYHCPSCHYPFDGPGRCGQCFCDRVAGEPPRHVPVDELGASEGEAVHPNIVRIQDAHRAMGLLGDAGCVSVIGDKLAPVFDDAAGRSFDSRAERRAFYKAHDLRRVSLGEATRTGFVQNHSCMGRTMSYPGQKDRRTSSERTPNH